MSIIAIEDSGENHGMRRWAVLVRCLVRSSGQNAHMRYINVQAAPTQQPSACTGTRQAFPGVLAEDWKMTKAKAGQLTSEIKLAAVISALCCGSGSASSMSSPSRSITLQRQHPVMQLREVQARYSE
jgi:hypothetical protein